MLDDYPLTRTRACTARRTPAPRIYGAENACAAYLAAAVHFPSLASNADPIPGARRSTPPVVLALTCSRSRSRVGRLTRERQSRSRRGRPDPSAGGTARSFFSHCSLPERPSFRTVRPSRSAPAPREDTRTHARTHIRTHARTRARTHARKEPPKPKTLQPVQARAVRAVVDAVHGRHARLGCGGVHLVRADVAVQNLGDGLQHVCVVLRPSLARGAVRACVRACARACVRA